MSKCKERGNAAEFHIVSINYRRQTDPVLKNVLPFGLKFNSIRLIHVTKRRRETHQAHTLYSIKSLYLDPSIRQDIAMKNEVLSRLMIQHEFE